MLKSALVKRLAQEAGFHACGVTRPNPVPEAEETIKLWTSSGKHGEMKYLENYEKRKKAFWSQFPNAKSIIVLGVNYYSKHATGRAVPGTENSEKLTGRVARYAWGRDYHRLMAQKIEVLKAALKEKTSDKIYFESAVDTKPLLERTLAQQAGLGFIGKQTQLLSLQFGPWLFLSEIVTNLELDPDEPFNGSCGTCRRCIDECPTQAISVDGDIDARQCIAYLTIEHKSKIPESLKTKIGDRIFGCDECLNICPYTAKQKETDWKELTAEEGVGPELDLSELFALKSNKQYRDRFRDSAILRANRKQLLRNAAVVFDNKREGRFSSKAFSLQTDLPKEIRRSEFPPKGYNNSFT